MKLYYLIISLVILMVGCTQAPQEPTAPEPLPQEQVPDIPSPPVVEPDVEPDVQAPPIEEIPDDLKDLLTKGKTKIKSYTYTYSSPDVPVIYSVWVKGTKIKKEQIKYVDAGNGKVYNTVFLDTAAKTAEAYCLKPSWCEGDLGKITDLDFDKEILKDPLEFLTEVTSAKKIDEVTVEGRDSVRLETNMGIITLEKWYGWPYSIDDGENIWSFGDAAFDTVKDSEVMP
ncbi:MAG TPA: hypothetical protein VJH97_03160 [Candidatus Nanoarchaeia archaeon]|nr:hypothetical protein [Candidatus Nanoarchaeia archaeon]